MSLVAAIDGVSGLFQLLTAFYALRISLIFGAARVGWSVFFAFSFLAVLQLMQAAMPPGLGAGSLLKLEAIYALISFILFVFLVFAGLAQIEIIIKERLQSERIKRQTRLGLESKTDNHLSQNRGFHPGKENFKGDRQKTAGLISVKPTLFESFSEMIANIPPQSILRVLAAEAYMLGVDLAQHRPLLPKDVGSILIFSRFIEAGGKRSQSVLASVELPSAHVAFYRATVERLIEAGELPPSSSQEFGKIFGGCNDAPEVGQSLLPKIYDRFQQYQIGTLANCRTA